MSDIPPPPPPERLETKDKKSDAGYKSLAPVLKDSAREGREPVSEHKAKDDPNQKLTPEEKEALAKLDATDPSKTTGHVLLDKLEEGLKKKDPESKQIARLLGEVLTTKQRDHSADAYVYVSDPTKEAKVRLGLGVTKAELGRMYKLAEFPKDQPYSAGPEGIMGSSNYIDARIGQEKYLAVLKFDSTLGQAFALRTLMMGGSAEQIKAANADGTTYQALMGAIASIGTASAQNRSVGRTATADNATRRDPNKNEARVKDPAASSENKAPLPENKPVRESRNAGMLGFGRETPLKGEKGVHTDDFDGTSKFITSSRSSSQAANTADRATITESQEYSKQLYIEKKVGLQRPGVVNERGADFVVFNDKENKIEIYDSKMRGPNSSFPTPKSTTEIMKKWGTEVDRAINGWTDAKGNKVGGVDTGNPALDKQIKDAWAQGRVEAHQINVRGPELPLHAPNKFGPL